MPLDPDPVRLDGVAIWGTWGSEASRSTRSFEEGDSWQALDHTKWWRIRDGEVTSETHDQSYTPLGDARYRR
jgi:hypothetical protein